MDRTLADRTFTEVPSGLRDPRDTWPGPAGRRTQRSATSSFNETTQPSWTASSGVGSRGTPSCARFGRLFRQYSHLSDFGRTRSAGDIERVLREIEAFEHDYVALHLGGGPPPEPNLFLIRLRGMRKELEELAAHNGLKSGQRPADGARSPSTRPSAPPAIAGMPAAIDRGNRLWYVPLPIRQNDWAGEILDYGQAPAKDWWGGNGSKMLACGDALDVIWNENVVRFLRADNVLETVLAYKRGKNGVRITDAKWDGKRLWLGRRGEGIWVLDAAGEVVAHVRRADGLPTAAATYEPLLLEPLGDGRVFATGAFDRGQRSWCAVVSIDFGPNGHPVGSPRVQVVHQGSGRNAAATRTTPHERTGRSRKCDPSAAAGD